MTSTKNSQLTQIFWGYVNVTNHLQIIRSANLPDWYFERVIFPGQRLLFEAPSDALLEVYTSHITDGSGVNKALKPIVTEVLNLSELKKNGTLLTPLFTLFSISNENC